jgi:hypothetical protein
MHHLVNSLARCDAMEIVLRQHERSIEAPAGYERSDLHLPPNLSGDVLAWALENQGEFQAASYVVSAVKSMRRLQAVLGLPLSSASQVLTGLRLTAAQRVVDASTVHWIEKLVRERWGEEATSVLGTDWSESVERALHP